MQCGKCGEPVVEGAHFCGNCGARVDAPPQRVGQTIAGRYRLVRQVGEGGMGSVYEAEQTLGSTRRSVAVKLLRPEWSHDPSVQARFHREAATVARLEHFNTVRVYDFGATEDGTLFIVMEFLHGHSLQKLLDEGGALPPERVEHIAGQIAASLEEAHGIGIIHRDLKPDNILLIDSYASQRDVVKLVDFGIAKGEAALGAQTTKLTELGAFVGTPAYMSPEQFSPGGLGPQSDIYALGITTYQMLAGRLPFDAQTTLEWAYAHTSKPPRPLEDSYGAGNIPDGMRSAVMRALSKDPAQRPSSATLFSRELAGRTVREPVPVVTGPAPGAGASAASAAEPARSAAAAPAPAPAAPAPVAPLPTSAAPVVAGGPRTAPMIEFPDLSVAAEKRGAPTTQPMAAVSASDAVAGSAHARDGIAQAFRGLAPPAPAPARSSAGRIVAWVVVVLGGASSLALLAWGVWGPGGLPGFAREPDVAPPPLVPEASNTPEPSPPAPPEPAIPEPPARPDPAPSRPPESPRPAAPKPAAPKPATPAPAPQVPAQPAPGTPLPSLPGLPGTEALPGQPSPAQPSPSPTQPSPTPSPGQPAPVPGLPQLPQMPWNLPTAGACERCLQALQGSGNYIVVNAVAESLLCEDRTARASCERQIDEVAPQVAERAARAGDCPAAIATAAAAVNVRVSPDRFRNIDALCGLR